MCKEQVRGMIDLVTGVIVTTSDIIELHVGIWLSGSNVRLQNYYIHSTGVNLFNSPDGIASSTLQL